MTVEANSKTAATRRNHVEGSRKGKVHDLFDQQGPEAAWTLGLKLKLQQSTLRSWFGQWRRENAAAAVKAAKAEKPEKAAKPPRVTKPEKAAKPDKVTKPTVHTDTADSAAVPSAA